MSKLSEAIGYSGKPDDQPAATPASDDKPTAPVNAPHPFQVVPAKVKPTGYSTPAIAPAGGPKDMPTYTGPVTPVPGSIPGAGKDMPATAPAGGPKDMPTGPGSKTGLDTEPDMSDQVQTPPPSPGPASTQPEDTPATPDKTAAPTAPGGPKPTKLSVLMGTPVTPAAPEDKAPVQADGILAGLARGYVSSLGGVPGDEARGVQTLLQLGQVITPGSETDKKFDAAHDFRPGESWNPKIQSFTDIHGVGDAMTYVSEGAGSMAGSVTSFAVHRLIGTALGSAVGAAVAGTAAVETGPGEVVAIPAGGAVGAATGAALTGAGSIFLQSVGQTRDSIMQEPALAKAVKDGTLDYNVINAASAVSGALMTLVEYPQQIRMLTGGKANDVSKEAIQEVVKKSLTTLVKASLKEGVKVGTEEAIQQAVQDAAQAVASGDPALARRIEDVANSFLQSVVPGMVVGGTHHVRGHGGADAHPDATPPADGTQTPATPEGAPPPSGDGQVSQANPQPHEGTSTATHPGAADGQSTPGGVGTNAPPVPTKEATPEEAAKPATPETTATPATTAPTQEDEGEQVVPKAAPGAPPVREVSPDIAAAFGAFGGTKRGEPVATGAPAASGPATVIATATAAGQAEQQRQAQKTAPMPAAPVPQPSPAGATMEPRPAPTPQPAAAPAPTNVQEWANTPQGQAYAQRQEAVRARKEAEARAAQEQGPPTGAPTPDTAPEPLAPQPAEGASGIIEPGEKTQAPAEPAAAPEPTIAPEPVTPAGKAAKQVRERKPKAAKEAPAPPTEAAPTAKEAPAPAEAAKPAGAAQQAKATVSARKGAYAVKQSLKGVTHRMVDAAGLTPEHAKKLHDALNEFGEHPHEDGKLTGDDVHNAIRVATAAIDKRAGVPKERVAKTAPSEHTPEEKAAIEKLRKEHEAKQAAEDWETHRRIAEAGQKAEQHTEKNVPERTAQEGAEKAASQIEGSLEKTKPTVAPANANVAPKKRGLKKVLKSFHERTAERSNRPAKPDEGVSSMEVTTKLAPTQKEYLLRSKIDKVASMLHAEILPDARQTLSGEKDVIVAHTATEQAIEEHLPEIRERLTPSEQMDPKEHPTVGSVYRDIQDRVKARARELTDQHLEKKILAKATENVRGVDFARLTQEARERGEDIHGNKLAASDRGQKRAGKWKGKSARDVFLEKDDRPFRRRHESAAGKETLSAHITKLYERLAGLRGGNIHDEERNKERTEVQDELKKYYEAEKEEARKQAELDEAEEAAKKPDDSELIKAEAEKLRRTQEEQERAEEEAEAAKYAEKIQGEDKALDRSLAANPQIQPKELRGRSSAVQTNMLVDRVRNLIKQLRQELGVTKPTGSLADPNVKVVKVPARLSRINSKAMNFLVQANHIMNTDYAIGEDRKQDLITLAHEMESAKTPLEFFDNIKKAADDFSQNHKIDLENPKYAPDYDKYDRELREQEDATKSDEDAQDLSVMRKPQASTVNDNPNEMSPEQHATVHEAGEVNIINKAGDAPQGIEVTPIGLRSNSGSVRIQPSQIRNVRDLLKGKPGEAGKSFWRSKNKLSAGATTLHDWIRRFLDKRIMQRLGDMPVYVLSDHDIRTLRGTHGESSTTFGFFAQASTQDIAKGSKGILVLHENALRPGNEGDMHYIMRHELAHALTMHALIHNIDGARDMMKGMLDKLKADLRAEGKSYMFNDPGHDEFHNGLRDVYEMVADAFSNKAFQEFLASRGMPPGLLKKLGMHTPYNRTPQTYWHGFLSAIQKVMKMTGFGEQGTNYLEAVIRMNEASLRKGDYIQSHAQGIMAGRVPGATPYHSPFQIRNPDGSWRRQGPEHQFSDMPSEAPLDVADFGMHHIASATASSYKSVMEQLNDPNRLGSWRRRNLNKMQTMHHLAQNMERYYGRDPLTNGFHRILDAVRKAGYYAKVMMQRGDDVAARLGALPTHMGDRLSALMHDSTLHQINAAEARAHPSNAHITNGNLSVLRREMHTKLRDRFNALTPREQQIYRDAGAHYEAQENERVAQQVHTILTQADAANALPARATSVTIQHMTDWVMNGGFERMGTTRELPTDVAMMRRIDTISRALKDATSLRKIKGYYVNLARYGDYFVKAKMHMVVPDGAQAVGNNQFMFRDPAAMQAWAANNEEHLAKNIQSLHLLQDPVTGRVEQVSPQEIRYHNGVQVPVIQHFLVTPQLEHFERFEHESEARDRSNELNADPAYHSVSHHGLAQELTRGPENDILSSTMRKMIEQTTQNLPDQATKDQVTRQLVATILRNNVGTRITQRQRQRRGVHGFNKNLVRSLADYNVSVANHIAKLRALPEISAGRQMITDDLKNRQGRDYDQHNSAIRIQETLAAVEDQLKSNETFNPGSPGSRFIQSAMAISFLNHLASVSNWAINGLQTGMVTAPYLAARHGVWRTTQSLKRAYGTIGAISQIKGGFGNMLHPLNPKELTNPLVAGLRAKGMNDEASVIEALRERDLISHDAGREMEVNQIRKGVFGKGLSRVAAVASAVPTAMENVNRSTAALAAYWLKKQDGATHEQAVLHAIDTVNDTHGDYNSATTAMMFKHPLLRAVLQFKKYPQMMSRLLYRSAAQAIFAGATPQERNVARKQLLWLAATHMMVAGAGGAPFMEIPKLLLMLAHGISPNIPDYGDMENWLQQMLSGWMNGKLAEAAMHGLPRLLGADLSGRMGLDSLMFFGEPRNNNRGEYDTNSVKAWALDTLSGAPASLVVNLFSGLSDVAAGNWRDAIHQLPVPKLLGDLYSAANAYAAPKDKASGIPDFGSQLSWKEAAWKALGFQPARMAERYEYGGDKYSDIQKSNVGRGKHDRVQEWVSAKPGADRNEIWKQIREENKGKPSAERISYEQLTKAASRRKTDTAKAKKEHDKYVLEHQ